ncbi:hypothetical protein [Marinihelvus fidelis]|uniref:hypothetical protein n=1 Tax=Marinihelvus fidelis TaxID=2613842 RepID=UPI0017835DF2|nr:hypothetical protein [Marinihelvus fidelis]
MSTSLQKEIDKTVSAIVAAIIAGIVAVALMIGYAALFLPEPSSDIESAFAPLQYLGSLIRHQPLIIIAALVFAFALEVVIYRVFFARKHKNEHRTNG